MATAVKWTPTHLTFSAPLHVNNQSAPLQQTVFTMVYHPQIFYTDTRRNLRANLMELDEWTRHLTQSPQSVGCERFVIFQECRDAPGVYYLQLSMSQQRMYLFYDTLTLGYYISNRASGGDVCFDVPRVLLSQLGILLSEIRANAVKEFIKKNAEANSNKPSEAEEEVAHAYFGKKVTKTG